MNLNLIFGTWFWLVRMAGGGKRKNAKVGEEDEKTDIVSDTVTEIGEKINGDEADDESDDGDSSDSSVYSDLEKEEDEDSDSEEESEAEPSDTEMKDENDTS